MNIYRYLQNDKLYIIERVTPPKILGSHYEATPFMHNEKLTQKFNNLDRFILKYTV